MRASVAYRQRDVTIRATAFACQGGSNYLESDLSVRLGMAMDPGKRKS
jgi:hypothetical protein